ncbi:MerR family transcriptional regulator [Aeromicrobium sp.]|uniref:MerR family transcriptional regulator n=1 Tax=Aeromicrobium sp. TaxID=1871063 RepID=UPI003C496DFE
MSRPQRTNRGKAAGTSGATGPFGEPDAGSDLTWGVGAVSSRLSVTASTLRTWERRYGVGPSFRTQGGHRRYTEQDIERVELMRRLLTRGVSARDAARVARSLDGEGLDLALRDRNGDPTGASPTQDLLTAVASGDRDELSRLFASVLRQTPVIEAWRDVLAPVLRQMTTESGSGAGAEAADAASAASELLVRELSALLAFEQQPDRGHTHILFARSLPAVEAIPLMVLEVALVQAGVTTRTVGPELDGRAVAALATRLRPDLLLTWGHPPTPPLRRAMSELEGVTSVIRALPAWPKEMSLRFGFEGPVVSTDVEDAVGIILDHVP